MAIEHLFDAHDVRHGGDGHPASLDDRQRAFAALQSAAALSFERLRKIADGPFDLFLVPLIFAQEYEKDRSLPFNEAKRGEIRKYASGNRAKAPLRHRAAGLYSWHREIAERDQAAGLKNILLTTGGRRYKHEAMEKAGIGGYFEEIVDRDQTYYAKEQGIYSLYRKHRPKHMRVVLAERHGQLLKSRPQRAWLQGRRHLSRSHSDRARDRACLQRRGNFGGGQAQSDPSHALTSCCRR